MNVAAAKASLSRLESLNIYQMVGLRKSLAVQSGAVPSRAGKVHVAINSRPARRVEPLDLLHA